MHPYAVLAILAMNQHLEILLDGPAAPRRAPKPTKPSRRSRVVAALKSYQAPTSRAWPAA